MGGGEPSAITSVTFPVLLFRSRLGVQELRVEESFIAFTDTSQQGRAASARAFVHSLNILIKYARMYGFDHKRSG